MSRCICGLVRARLLYTSHEYEIVRCLLCNQVRTVTPTGISRLQYYDDTDLSIYIKKETMFRSIFQKKVAFIKKFKNRGNLLDIGAGVGLFVSEARKSGFSATGVEPSAHAVHSAKENFDIQLLSGEFSLEKTKRSYDIVLLNHVLEHLPDPKKILRDLTTILRPHGLLVVGVPNINSFMSKIKRERWQSLIPNQHRWHFTISTLDQLILPMGLERLGIDWENHSRRMHYWWKKPIYWVLDEVALLSGYAEAMFVVYRLR